MKDWFIGISIGFAIIFATYGLAWLAVDLPMRPPPTQEELAGFRLMESSDGKWRVDKQWAWGWSEGHTEWSTKAAAERDIRQDIRLNRKRQADRARTWQVVTNP